MPKKKIIVSGVYNRGGKLRVEIALKEGRRFITVGEWTQADAVRWSEQRAIINQQIRFDRFRWQDWFTPEQWGEDRKVAGVNAASTFGDCVAALEAEMASGKPQSLDVFRSRIKKWDALRPQRARTLKPTELRQVFNAAGCAKMAPNSQRSVISACSKVLALAKQNGVFAGDLESYYALTEKLGDMVPDRGKNSKPKLTMEQVDLLLATIRDNFRPVYHDWYEVMLFSGMRPCEARALEWTDIDFVNGVIDVNKAKHAHYEVQTPKTAASVRRIRMLPRAKDALLRRWNAEGCPMSGIVFKHPSTDGYMDYHHATGKYARETTPGVWYEALELAGLPRMRPYSTRHTYATALHNAGLEDRLTARQLGHVNTTVLHETYVEFRDQPGDIEAIDAVAGRLERANSRAKNAANERALTRQAA